MRGIAWRGSRKLQLPVRFVDGLETVTPCGGDLAENVSDDLGGFDAGELLVEALIFEGELVVVDSELVKDGGVEVADVDGVLGDVVAEVVGLAIDFATFDAAASHPHGEGARVVIAAVVCFGEGAL